MDGGPRFDPQHLGRRAVSRRDVLRAGAAAGAGLGMSKLSRHTAPTARLLSSGAKGLGPGGSLLPPGSRPFPHMPAGTDTMPKLEHIVVLMMENHSFDDHLGILGRGDGLTLGPDGKPVNYNPDPSGGYVRSFPMPNTSASYQGIDQSWDTSHICWDHGTNMGFVEGCGPVAMGYWTAKELPFYHGMASQFPIGDRYFCSVMAQTYPNRRFLIAATALGDVSTNYSGISQNDAPNGTIFDRLDHYGISWKNYFPDVPTCALFLPVFSRAATDGKVVQNVNHFLADASAGRLPQFSLVDPYTNFSEENGDISVGEAFAARVIDAVLSSPKWSSTALIWVYDEHGGWYDHVPPVPAVKPDNVPPEIDPRIDQPGAYDYTGFRVPCCVVSAWSKRDYVSHNVFDHTSILKLLETKWNLPALTYRDANALDMTDFFDFGANEPPFADPPVLPQPLNPFVGPLPSSSAGAHPAGFHPIATSLPESALPPASYLTAEPPANAAALIASHTAAALGQPSSSPARNGHGNNSGSDTPAILGGTLGGAAVLGAALVLGLRRRGRGQPGPAPSAAAAPAPAPAPAGAVPEAPAAGD
jgi:phospholipase C